MSTQREGWETRLILAIYIYIYIYIYICVTAQRGGRQNRHLKKGPMGHPCLWAGTARPDCWWAVPEPEVQPMGRHGMAGVLVGP
jgi:hypothetical protein